MPSDRPDHLATESGADVIPMGKWRAQADALAYRSEALEEAGLALLRLERVVGEALSTFPVGSPAQLARTLATASVRILHAAAEIEASGDSYVGGSEPGDGHSRKTRSPGGPVEMHRSAQPLVSELDVNELPLGVVVIDAELGAVLANRAWSQLANRTISRSLGSGWLGAFDDRLRAQIESDVHHVMSAACPDCATEWELRAGGREPRWVSARLHRQTTAQGAVRCTIALVEITASKRHADELERRATHDALTGVADRLLLEDRTEHGLARQQRTGRELALVFVDLDSFKAVNERFGHQGGDEVLQIVAQRLVAAVRVGDTVARVGGDEFAVLCEEVTVRESVWSLARRLVDASAGPIVRGVHELRIGASVGVAFSVSGDSFAGLLHRADSAMFLAKARGGACVVAVDGRGDIER